MAAAEEEEEAAAGTATTADEAAVATADIHGIEMIADLLMMIAEEAMMIVEAEVVATIEDMTVDMTGEAVDTIEAMIVDTTVLEIAVDMTVPENVVGMSAVPIAPPIVELIVELTEGRMIAVVQDHLRQQHLAMMTVDVVAPSHDKRTEKDTWIVGFGAR